MSSYDYEPTGEGLILLTRKGKLGPSLKLTKSMALDRYYDLKHTFGAARLRELKDLQAALELEFDYHV